MHTPLSSERTTIGVLGGGAWGTALVRALFYTRAGHNASFTEADAYQACTIGESASWLLLVNVIRANVGQHEQAQTLALLYVTPLHPITCL